MIEREIGEIIYSNLNEWVGFDSTSLMFTGRVWKCSIRLTHFTLEINYDIVRRIYKVLVTDGRREIKLSKSARFNRDIRRIIRRNGLDMGLFAGHIEAMTVLVKERLDKKGRMSSLARRYWLRLRSDGIKIK